MKETDKLAEEIFCLKYELDTLANVLLRNEAERWLPGFLHERTEQSHLERYRLACNYTAGKKVLDVACGIGKGSNMMAQTGGATFVNGFDIQPEALRYANWRNAAPNLNFSVVNAETMDIVDEYDLVVSFETIEHLPNYKKFLSNIKKSLKSGGYLLISTPLSAVPIDSSPANPYHIQEWGFASFQNVLKDLFFIENTFVQLYPTVTIGQKSKKRSLITRLFNILKRELYPPTKINEPQEQPLNKFSKIEEYTGQYPETELGSKYIGYQIVLARKH